MTSRSLRARLAARVGRLLLDVELDTGAGTLVVQPASKATSSALASSDVLVKATPNARGAEGRVCIYSCPDLSGTKTTSSKACC